MNAPTTPKKAIERCTTAVSPDLSVCYTLYCEEADAGIAYSIEATVIQTGESAVARDVTRIDAKARRMFHMMYRGGVTPCCLHEIAEDLIETLISEDELLP